MRAECVFGYDEEREGDANTYFHRVEYTYTPREKGFLFAECFAFKLYKLHSRKVKIRF